MIICDYCGEPITGTSFQLGGAGPLTAGQPNETTDNVHLDLHPECASTFRGEVKKIKGNRPR